jgi:hypothetical protein
MAGDPENPPQSYPCIPSPRHTPQNRPHTPTAALTGLQTARAPQAPPRRIARRHHVCPARPPRARATASGASQRAPTPSASSPACRLVPTAPSPHVSSCCLPGKAPAAEPCTAQPTPRFPPVRSSGRRPTRTKALESSGRGGPRRARRYFEVRGPSSGGIGKRGGTPHYAARYPALIRWRWIDDFLLKSEGSHWVSCVPTKPIYLQNKNRTATCFCHTILEFAAAEKSLGLYGHKIGINSSWTGV